MPLLIGTVGLNSFLNCENALGQEQIVFLIETATLGVGGKDVEELDEQFIGAPFSVYKSNGDWLWVKANQQGWLHRKHTVPLDKAKEFFTDRIKQNPLDVESFRGRGYANRLTGQVDDSLKDFTRAVEIAPQRSRLYVNRTEAQLLASRWEAAIEDCNQALELHEENDDIPRLLHVARYFRGFAHEKLGNVELALEDYNSVLESIPETTTDATYANAQLRRGIIWRESGQLEQALKDFNVVISKNPNYNTPLLERGLTYERGREWEQAKQDYRKVIGLNPNSAFVQMTPSGQIYAKEYLSESEYRNLNPERSAYFNLIMLLSTCPEEVARNGEEAVELAKKLRGIDSGKYFQFVAAEAAAFAEAGNFSKAIELQKKALDITPIELVEEFQQRLRIYEEGKPLRIQE